MKPSSRVAAVLSSVLFAALLFAGLLAGCASIGMGRKPGPSATVQTVADDYRQAQRQTAATQAALDGLAVTADADLKQSFVYFSENLDQMEQIGKRLVTHADGMFYRGTYYFVESGRSLEACAFPRTGKTDEQPNVDLGKDFYAISAAGGEIKRAYRAFQFDIEQINDALARDLTPSGVDAMEQLLRKAKVDSASLQETLRQALTALERAKTALSLGASQKG